MSITYNLTCTCAACGATKTGTAAEMGEAGWVRLAIDRSNGKVKPIVIDGWGDPLADDCICKDCYDAYYALQEKADEAQQAAYDAMGKFTPTPSPSGGSGTVDDPYTFEAGVVCVLNAYYRHGEHVYVYMPADAEAKSYDSWEAAEADFAIWDEDTTETSETA